MVLLSDSLSMWDVGFRWANHDPDSFCLRIPLEVRDNFRNLMDAVLKAELPCVTITLMKPSNDANVAVEDTVYGHLDDIYGCIWGKRHKRKLLQRAEIERYDFKLWCERRGIPLPAFWFAPGWKLEYELPEDEMRPGYAYVKRQDAPPSEHIDAEELLTDGDPSPPG